MKNFLERIIITGFVLGAAVLALFVVIALVILADISRIPPPPPIQNSEVTQ